MIKSKTVYIGHPKIYRDGWREIKEKYDYNDEGALTQQCTHYVLMDGSRHVAVVSYNKYASIINIMLLYVVPAYRNQGLTRRLFDGIENDKNLPINMVIKNNNEPMLNLVKKMKAAFEYSTFVLRNE